MEASLAVYLIIDITVRDQELYDRYVSQAKPIVESHGGRYLVQGSEIRPLSGDWNPERIVVIEFSSAEAMNVCFQSVEYEEIASLRVDSITSRTILVEGLER